MSTTKVGAGEMWSFTNGTHLFVIIKTWYFFFNGFLFLNHHQLVCNKSGLYLLTCPFVFTYKGPSTLRPAMGHALQCTTLSHDHLVFTQWHKAHFYLTIPLRFRWSGPKKAITFRLRATINNCLPLHTIPVHNGDRLWASMYVIVYWGLKRLRVKSESINTPAYRYIQ